MRIALAGLSHETNTYCQGLTTSSDFHALRGRSMLNARGQETDVGGAVGACAELGAAAVPIVFAQAQPSGTIARETFEAFADEIVDGLSMAGELDAVVLLLHGAGVAEGVADLEGELAARVRRCVGTDVPIAASFDLHGNITPFMCEQLNGVFACHQYPHIDLHEQGARAVRHVAAQVQSGRRAQCQMINVPMLLPTTTTFEGVGERMLADVLDVEQGHSIVDLSWFHGFPYTDTAHVGSALVLTSYADELAEEAAGELLDGIARQLWAAREAFRPQSLDASEAVATALGQVSAPGDAPVVIHETSDNCGAGTPGDGTHLLRAMLDAGLGERACFGFIVDAQTAAQAHAAGVGAQISVQLGGRTDDLHGDPIVTDAQVKALHDGRLTLQHMFRGAPLNLGPLARLVIDGMDVVVGSRRSQTFDKEPFLAVGIDVMRYDIVALKSSNHFRACFQDIAKAIVTADTPGLSTHNISVFPRQATSRRLWPLDERAAFPETET